MKPCLVQRKIMGSKPEWCIGLAHSFPLRHRLQTTLSASVYASSYALTRRPDKTEGQAKLIGNVCFLSAGLAHSSQGIADRKYVHASCRRIKSPDKIKIVNRCIRQSIRYSMLILWLHIIRVKYALSLIVAEYPCKRA